MRIAHAVTAAVLIALGACSSGGGWEHPQLGTARLQADLDACALAAQKHARDVTAAAGTTALSPLKSAPARAGHVYDLGKDQPPTIGGEPAQPLNECMREKGYQRRD